MCKERTIMPSSNKVRFFVSSAIEQKLPMVFCNKNVMHFLTYILIFHIFTLKY